MAGTIVLDKIQLDNGTSSFQLLSNTGSALLTVSQTSISAYSGNVAIQQNGVFVENSQILSSNYTVTTGKSAMAAGPVTIAANVTVTIPANSRLVIV